jgi:hypothetical protein
MRTFETAEYAAVAAGVATVPTREDGSDVAIILRAVFGIDVSMVCEDVNRARRSRSGVKLSTGSRTAKGPILDLILAKFREFFFFFQWLFF